MFSLATALLFFFEMSESDILLTDGSGKCYNLCKKIKSGLFKQRNEHKKGRTVWFPVQPSI